MRLYLGRYLHALKAHMFRQAVRSLLPPSFYLPLKTMLTANHNATGCPCKNISLAPLNCRQHNDGCVDGDSSLF